jgi:hypothetical protein
LNLPVDLPSEDLFRESAYLVERAVRALALVGVCDASRERELETRLAAAAGRTVPFIIPEASTRVFGFAAAAWVIDLFQWTRREAPATQRDRIVGLLLGYGVEAIRTFDEWERYLPGGGSRDEQVRSDEPMPEV